MRGESKISLHLKHLCSCFKHLHLLSPHPPFPFLNASTALIVTLPSISSSPIPIAHLNWTHSTETMARALLLPLVLTSAVIIFSIFPQGTHASTFPFPLQCMPESTRFQTVETNATRLFDAVTAGTARRVHVMRHYGTGNSPVALKVSPFRLPSTSF